MAMENQYSPQSDSEGAAPLPFMFLTLIAVAVLICVGVFGGYLLGQSNSKDQSKSQHINTLVSPAADQGLQLPDSSNSNANTNTNWTIYTDVAFSIKYPTNWLIKKGFSTKDDLVIYDPTTVKQVTQNGTQERIPGSFVDILSVTAATQSAAQMVSSYKMQASNSAAIKTEQSTTLGENLVLVNMGNPSSNTILWSQNGMVAQFTSSIQHLSDTSIENKILQTFQFIKQ